MAKPYHRSRRNRLVVAVSVLKPGDEELHYPENPHRWLSPQQGVGEDAWSERVQAHMAAHGRQRDTPSRLVIHKLREPPNQGR